MYRQCHLPTVHCMKRFNLFYIKDQTDESGTTLCEYGLLAALTVGSIIGGINATGTSWGDFYIAWVGAVAAAIAATG